MTQRRVLLADDHAGFLAALGRLLVQGGYDVVGSVGDGVRLVEEAARLETDVIVVDLHMPKMNGIEACRELTRMNRQTRIIVLTANGDEHVRQMALEAGAFALIHKQSGSQDLLNTLAVACGNLQDA